MKESEFLEKLQNKFAIKDDEIKKNVANNLSWWRQVKKYIQTI